MSLLDLASNASPLGAIGDVSGPITPSATSGAKSTADGILSTGIFNPAFGGGGVSSQLPLFAVLGVGGLVAWLLLRK